MLKFGPDPVNVTFCEPPVALSVMFRVPDSGPYTLGVRLTLMVQVSSGEMVAGVVPQVLVCEKSPLFVPVKVIPVRLRSWPPVLLNVTGCEPPIIPSAHWPSARVDGVAVAAGVKGTKRMRLLPPSATNRLPLASTDAPRFAIRALVAGPLSPPKPP